MSIIEEALGFLKTREFVALASADKDGKPNSAPKLLLKIDGHVVYFIDYSIGRTFENLNVNPEVSLSFIDIVSFVGYRLNGKVEIIEAGHVYEECLRELSEREIKLSVERVVKAVQEGKRNREIELGLSSHVLVYKVKIKEGCVISPRGEIKQENN